MYNWTPRHGYKTLTYTIKRTENYRYNIIIWYENRYDNRVKNKITFRRTY